MNNDINQNQEQTVTLKQVLTLLFGNTKRYIIIGVISLIVSFVLVFFLNKSKEDYTSVFTFDCPGLTEETYIDGSSFKIDELVTLSKLKEYQSEHNELKGLDMDDIYYNGGIKEFAYKEYYKENPLKTSTNDPDQVLDYKAYSITLSRSFFTKEQATVLIQAISNEPLEITKEKVNDIRYDRNFELYANANSYEKQVEYIKNQIDTIKNAYKSLVTTLGNLRVPNGNYGTYLSGTVTETVKVISEETTLNDLLNEFNAEIGNYDIEKITTQLTKAGYILVSNTNTKENTLAELQQKLDNYNKQQLALTENKAINALELDAIDDYINSLIEASKGSGTTTSSLQSLELASCNEQYIKLLNENSEIDKELKDLEKKIANIVMLVNEYDDDSTTEPVGFEAYEEELTRFKNSLEAISICLIKHTSVLTDAAKVVRSNSCNVYYNQSGVVATVESMPLYAVALIAVACGIFVPMIVNCVIAIANVANPKEEKETK